MNQAERLVRWLGSYYIVLAVLDVASVPISTGLYGFFYMLTHISVGVGMFEKFSWSRHLGMAIAAFRSIASILILFAYFFPAQLGSVTSSLDPRLTLPIMFTYLFSYPFCLYIFFRPDVKELFKPQERLPQ